MIVFVGDKPSSKNVDPRVPFVGTQSYKRLLEWIWEMDIDITNVDLMNKGDVSTHIRYGDIDLTRGRYKFIALGKNAQDELNRLSVLHFKLPHPSPRNFKLNNKSYVKNELEKCKIWLQK